MKTFLVIFLPLLIFAQGCHTSSTCNGKRYRVYSNLAESGLASLEALEAGDADSIDKAKTIAMMHLSVGLAYLHDLGSQSSRVEERTSLARSFLDFAVTHKESLVSVYGFPRTVFHLERLLTDESDLRRVAELKDYIAREETTE